MKAVLDIETGGFSITKNGVAEIGILILDENLNEIERYHTWIAPYTRADDTDELVSYKPDAIAVNGLTKEYLELRGADVKIVCVAIDGLFKKHQPTHIIGHNLQFDMPRVNYLLDRFVKSKLPEMEFLDTMILARKSGKFDKNDLTFICNKLEFQTNDAHTAIGDCLLSLEVLKYLTK